MSFARITPERVRKALETHKLKLVDGAWTKEEEGTCCPVTALMIDKGVSWGFIRQAEENTTVLCGDYVLRLSASRVLNLPRKYIDGFIAGYDGLGLEKSIPNFQRLILDVMDFSRNSRLIGRGGKNNWHWCVGYIDGLVVRKELLSNRSGIRKLVSHLEAVS